MIQWFNESRPRILSDCFEGKVIKQISVGPGGYHTIALTVSGTVYTWGHNRVGQLGYSNSDGVPRNVSSPTNAKESVQESKQRVYPFYHGWPYLRCPID